MSRMFVPMREIAEKWFKKPGFRAAYDALEDQFALVDALIGARGQAGMTQEQVAKAMGTTQAAIARLESGKLPSTRTLQRFAEATGTKLRITFEPVKKAERKSQRVSNKGTEGRNGRGRAGRKAA